MTVIRLGFLIVILAGLTIFSLQNLAPSLPLVFLGLKTRTLPLALWLLLAFVGGAFSHFAIAALFKLSNYLTARSQQNRWRSAAPSNPPRPRTGWQEPQSLSSGTGSTSRSSSTPDFDETDDFAEEPVRPRENPRDTPRERNTYEVRQEPKSESRSGSVYSYAYKDPMESGVGRTESVYDADYRVIVPPQSEPEGDDWGFEDEDDDWEADEPRDRPHA
jgi:uncharacterized integral membrane protein